jgi:hypothetical protein
MMNFGTSCAKPRYPALVAASVKEAALPRRDGFVMSRAMRMT